MEAEVRQVSTMLVQASEERDKERKAMRLPAAAEVIAGFLFALIGNNNKPVLLLVFLKRNIQVAPVLSDHLNLLRIYLNPDPVGPFAQVPFPLQRFPRPQG
jgi:hypothetical protein